MYASDLKSLLCEDEIHQTCAIQSTCKEPHKKNGCNEPFFSIIFLFHSHNFFLRSFCHIKNNASSTFSKSKKCNASFFSNFCFSLPPYTGISSRQMRYRLHPPASFLSRPSMERHSPLFRSANSDPADNLPLLY